MKYIIFFILICSFLGDYDSFLLDGLDIKVNPGYRQGLFRWNWNRIEMQRCEQDIFEHELTHYTMKRIGWSLRRSQLHDFVFEATQLYIQEHKS